MSAIHEAPQHSGAYQKQHTKIKVIVHSHQKLDPIILNDDVVQALLSKNIKGVGQCRLTVVPRVNFLNLLGPNDYVNVYFDKSDGRGWVRTFFGLIDRVEEDWSVSENGTPSTHYVLVCSDFMKIFDKTQYYTNPHLSGRDDFVNQGIGRYDASIALLSNGLLVQGSPPDTVAQIIFALLGFSGQFTTPDSYLSAISNTKIIGQNRQLRLNFAEALMSNDSVASLGPGGLDGAIRESQSSVPQVETLDESEVRAAAEAYQVNLNDLERSITNPARVQRLLENGAIARAIAAIPGVENVGSLGAISNSIVTIAQGTIPGRAPTMLDLINIGTFVEREAIDGFLWAGTIPNYQGSILKYLRSFSHDLVNELFFDLRPLSASGSGMAEGTQWADDPDEIAGNVSDNHGPTGVTYVPAMVMREYPFSVIDQVDGSGVTMSLTGANGEQERYGVYPFGAIFSNKPNAPGRHVIPFPNINIGDKMLRRNTRAFKHLDVAVISSSDIKRTTFGRSDTDHVNLLAMISDSGLGRAEEQYLKDLSPIYTPIHIQRHGLRVSILSTRYARLNSEAHASTRRQVGRSTQDPVTEPEPQETPAPPENANVFDYSQWHTPTIVSAVSEVPRPWYAVSASRRGVLTNVVLDRGSSRNGFANTRWGYVRGAGQGASAGHKRMHNGIDVYGQVGSPIYAVADGIVELAAVNGTYGIYGNMLYIRHPGARTTNGSYTMEGEGTLSDDYWSLYAHLGRPKYLGRGASGTAADGSNMRLNPNYDENDPVSHGIAINPATGNRFAVGDRVQRGQLIGYMGWSGGLKRTRSNRGNPITEAGTHRDSLYTLDSGRDRDGRRGGTYPPPHVHLHFEINREPFNSRRTRTRGVHFPSKVANGSFHELPLSQLSSTADPPYARDPSVADFLGSVDPVGFFSERGVDLFTATENLSTADETEQDGDVIEEEFEAEGDGTADQRSVTEQAGVDNQATADAQRASGPPNTDGETRITSGVDSATSRDLLARWTLLHDHWYQHNLEYVSGLVELARGAPEIRVGYRLDIADRNLSAYVEGVDHQYDFSSNGGALMTKLHVTRGQPNNPNPAYILPRTAGFSDYPDQKFQGSRLGKFFVTPDPLAIRNALVIRDSRYPSQVGESEPKNIMDSDQTLSRHPETYIVATSQPSELSGTSNKNFLSNLEPGREETLTGLPALSDAEVRSSVRELAGQLDGLTEDEILNLIRGDARIEGGASGIITGANPQGQVAIPNVLPEGTSAA